MSEREIDNYLNLLFRLLRLTVAQRADVVDELRDHLESRTEDLLSRGMSRDDAMQTALGELGDAAGLAHQLMFVSRVQRRRRIMKWSMGTIALVAFIAGGSLLWRPEQPGVQNGPRAIAQYPGAPAPTDPADGPGAAPGTTTPTSPGPGTGAPPGVIPGPGGSGSKPPPGATEGGTGGGLTVDFALAVGTGPQSDENAALDKLLDSERVEANFEGMNLTEVIAYLGDAADVEFVFDTQGLEDQGVNANEMTISLRLKKMQRLRTVLELVLERAGLNYTLRDGLVYVTSQDRTLAIGIYPREGIFRAMNARAVSSLITSTVRRAEWSSTGGSGTINVLPDRIVISHTANVQREVQQFLLRMRNQRSDLGDAGQIYLDTFTQLDAENPAPAEGLGGMSGQPGGVGGSGGAPGMMPGMGGGSGMGGAGMTGMPGSGGGMGSLMGGGSMHSVPAFGRGGGGGGSGMMPPGGGRGFLGSGSGLGRPAGGNGSSGDLSIPGGVPTGGGTKVTEPAEISGGGGSAAGR